MSEEKKNEKVIAFVLVATEIGEEYRIKEEIIRKAMEYGVEVEAYVVYGEYDIAARIAADNLRSVDKAITAIRSIRGVLRTVTLIAST